MSHSNLVNEFAGIANVNEEIAIFYLESTDWNIEFALARFYEESSHNNTHLLWHTSSMMSFFSSLRDPEDTDLSSNDEENLALTDTPFAGRSTTSGQEIIEVPRNNDNVISPTFQEAANRAIISPQISCGGSARESGSSNFLGTGYKLGRAENVAENIPSPSSTSEPFSGRIDTSLEMWEDINDGELHRENEPQNRDLLRLLVRGGKMPQSFLRKANVSNEKELHTNIEDKRSNEYVPTNKKRKVSEASGSALESAAPELGDNNPQKETSDNGVADEAAARVQVPLLPDALTTSLLIRLNDGTRLIATFNPSHTIRDIRRYIITARPSYASRPFQLHVSFPSITLDNDDQTLVEAGLLNTVIFLHIA